VIAAEKSGSKPSQTISWISTAPNPAASATAEPDMPENIMLATILTCPKLPGMCPTRAFANVNNLRLTPPMFMSSPASMKRGTASIGNESNGVIIMCGIAHRFIPFINIYITHDNPSENPTGTRITKKNKNATRYSQEFIPLFPVLSSLRE